jgi:hypothetical protein
MALHLLGIAGGIFLLASIEIRDAGDAPTLLYVGALSVNRSQNSFVVLLMH